MSSRRAQRRRAGCPATDKRRFSDKSSAQLALRTIQQDPSPGPKPVRVYWCKACGGFHLTSQEKRL